MRKAGINLKVLSFVIQGCLCLTPCHFQIVLNICGMVKMAENIGIFLIKETHMFVG